MNLNNYFYPKTCLFFLSFCLSAFLASSSVVAQTDLPYPMAGFNPERTSHAPQEIFGNQKPVWTKTFEPYILPRTQVIAANNRLFVTTSRGLYAVNAKTGELLWVFATSLPLADSPTVVNDTVYIGGFDKNMYAIDVATGNEKWRFSASQGFQVSPLVVNNTIYIGNRDGNFYALDAATGNLKWKFYVGAPIEFAAAYKDGFVFFGALDVKAYALDAATGNVKWISPKLPGTGFRSWWPVIFNQYVVFVGSPAYRHEFKPFGGQLEIGIEKKDLWSSAPKGTPIGPITENIPGPWPIGTRGLDISQPSRDASGSAISLAVSEYFETKPWRRTVFVFDRNTGKELTTDFDADGKPEYAPFIWYGEDSGNRFPPVVGNNGVMYLTQSYLYDPAIPDGGFVAWVPGSKYLGLIYTLNLAVDEPVAHVIGGNLLYENKCCDRYTYVYNLNQANANFVRYYNYNLPTIVPGYKTEYFSSLPPYDHPVTGYKKNGSYGFHGDVNPPTPYNGFVYIIRSNVLMAFGQTNTDIITTSPAAIKPVSSAISHPQTSEIQERLDKEVQKMISAGHLRPGYVTSGAMGHSLINNCGDNLGDYFHNTANTVTLLLRILPNVSDNLKPQLREYIKYEMINYPPYSLNHIGWKSGAARERFDTPPEFEQARNNYPPNGGNSNFAHWTIDPSAFYALWKYSLEFGNANNLFTAASSKSLLMHDLITVPADQILIDFPHIHDAYINAYIGYIQLAKLAGSTEDLTSKQATLDRLLSLRSDTITNDLPLSYLTKQNSYCRGLSTRNFLNLSPEIAQHLRLNALDKVIAIVREEEQILPYWFVTQPSVEFGEGIIRNLYDFHALFQAKAQILKEDSDALAVFIDVPAFETGDLFYMDNLAAVLSASSTSNKAGDFDQDGDIDIFDYNVLIQNFNTINCTVNLNGSCSIDIFDYNILIQNFGT